MSEIEAADTVFHRPTGETWFVKRVYRDSGGRMYLEWAGWPPGRALVEDCDLVETGSESDKAWLADQLREASR